MYSISLKKQQQQQQQQKSLLATSVFSVCPFFQATMSLPLYIVFQDLAFLASVPHWEIPHLLPSFSHAGVNSVPISIAKLACFHPQF